MVLFKRAARQINMPSPVNIWSFRAFMFLASAALLFGIAPRMSQTISASIARSKAHLPEQVVLTTFLRPSTCVFSDAGQDDLVWHNRKRRHRSARLTRWTPGRTPPERTGREKQEAFRMGTRTARVALKTRPQKQCIPPLRARLRFASAALRAVNAPLEKTDGKSTTLLTTLIGAAAHG